MFLETSITLNDILYHWCQHSLSPSNTNSHPPALRAILVNRAILPSDEAYFELQKTHVLFYSYKSPHQSPQTDSGGTFTGFWWRRESFQFDYLEMLEKTKGRCLYIYKYHVWRWMHYLLWMPLSKKNFRSRATSYNLFIIMFWIHGKNFNDNMK